MNKRVEKHRHTRTHKKLTEQLYSPVLLTLTGPLAVSIFAAVRRVRRLHCSQVSSAKMGSRAVTMRGIAQSQPSVRLTPREWQPARRCCATMLTTLDNQLCCCWCCLLFAANCAVLRSCHQQQPVLWFLFSDGQIMLCVSFLCCVSAASCVAFVPQRLTLCVSQQAVQRFFAALVLLSVAMCARVFLLAFCYLPRSSNN